jgi:hypothetical protein
MTFDEIRSDYVDNADYAETNSVAKCRAFITACRRLLSFPAGAASGNASTQFQPAAWQAERAAAEAWLATHSTASTDAGPRVTKADFRSFGR